MTEKFASLCGLCSLLTDKPDAVSPSVFEYIVHLYLSHELERLAPGVKAFLVFSDHKAHVLSLQPVIGSK